MKKNTKGKLSIKGTLNLKRTKKTIISIYSGEVYGMSNDQFTFEK